MLHLDCINTLSINLNFINPSVRLLNLKQISVKWNKSPFFDAVFLKTFFVFCNSFPCGFLFSSRLWHWSLESKKVYFLMRKELKACPASDIGRIKRFQNTFFKFLSDRSDVWSLQGEKVYRLIPRDIGHRPLLAILLPPKGSRKNRHQFRQLWENRTYEISFKLKWTFK